MLLPNDLDSIPDVWLALFNLRLKLDGKCVICGLYLSPDGSTWGRAYEHIEAKHKDLWENIKPKDGES